MLLNYIARQINEDLLVLSGKGRVELLNHVLDILANPHEKNEWFEETYWRKVPVPVKLTCSS